MYGAGGGDNVGGDLSDDVGDDDDVDDGDVDDGDVDDGDVDDGDKVNKASPILLCFVCNINETGVMLLFVVRFVVVVSVAVAAVAVAADVISVAFTAAAADATTPMLLSCFDNNNVDIHIFPPCITLCIYRILINNTYNSKTIVICNQAHTM